MPEHLGLSERWRQAALEPYTDAPRTTEEWLRALELGADAAVAVVLHHLRAEFAYLGMGGALKKIDPLLRELGQ